MTNDYSFKISVVGSMGSGKTTLCSLISGNPVAGVTIGLNVVRKIWQTSTGNIIVQFWDMAGHDSYERLILSYVAGSAGAIILCDCTDDESQNIAQKWVNHFLFEAQPRLMPSQLLLLANKKDMLNSSFMKYKSVSVLKEPDHVLELIHQFVSTIPNHKHKLVQDDRVHFFEKKNPYADLDLPRWETRIECDYCDCSIL